MATAPLPQDLGLRQDQHRNDSEEEYAIWGPRWWGTCKQVVQGHSGEPSPVAQRHDPQHPELTGIGGKCTVPLPLRAMPWEALHYHYHSTSTKSGELALQASTVPLGG